MSKVRIWSAVLFVVSLSSAQILLAAPNYSLDPAQSSLYFVSTKQTHIVEKHQFTAMSGSISETGEASLAIDLSSVETGIDIRNQRVRDLLFEVASFSEAIVTLVVDMSNLAAQVVGSTQVQTVSATLNFHGVTSQIDTEVIVTKLSDAQVLVQNTAPILIRAGDHNLINGIEALRNVANLEVISYAVPVNFTLLFRSQES